MPTAMPRKAARRRVLELVERFDLLRHMGLVLSVVVPLVGFNRVGCISLVRCRFFSAGFRRIESTGRRTPRSATEKLDFRGMRLPFGVVRVKPSISTGRAHTQRYTSSDGTRVPSDRFRPHCSGLSEPRGIAFSRRWPGLTCSGTEWKVGIGLSRAHLGNGVRVNGRNRTRGPAREASVSTIAADGTR